MTTCQSQTDVCSFITSSAFEKRSFMWQQQFLTNIFASSKDNGDFSEIPNQLCLQSSYTNVVINFVVLYFH
jgi:hypothetical protein